MFTSKIHDAINYMKDAHRSIGQTRKDGIRPYEVHPLEVALRVAAVTFPSFDENIVVAALLHDVIEDVFPLNPIYNIGLIRDIFGKTVADLVIELTDEFTKENYPTLNRAARKQKERERYATMSDKAKLIKLADIGTNLNDDGDVKNGESFGGADVGFNRMYIKEKMLCLPYLEGANKELFEEVQAILEVQKKKFDVR